jgi:hypothetical protein
MKQSKIIEHTKIKIPFREDMAKASLELRKNCTSRGDRYGSISDQFDVEATYFVNRFLTWGPKEVEKKTFELFAVRNLPIWYVAKYLHHAEGFPSEGMFISVWDELHEKKQFGDDLERMVWSHFYFPAGTCDYAPEDMVKRYARKVA